MSAADRRLDGPAKTFFGITESGVELVSVRFAQDQYVYVPNGPLPSLPFMPGGPRSVNVGCGDPSDRPQDFSKYGRHTESPRQNLRKPCVVRAEGIGSDEPRRTHLPGYYETSLLRPLDLPVDGGMRGACPCCDLGEAKFKVWISQQQRKDLALLLRAQDGQEGRRRLSIHYLKNTLQFADTKVGSAIKHQW